MASRIEPTNDRANGSSVQEQVQPVGLTLARSLQALVEAIPGAPHRPTPLSRRLGTNRVLASRLLNAIAQPDAYEVLQRVPGPESLRSITQAASTMDVDDRVIQDAEQAIGRFEQLIREEFGTRGALNAAISPNRPELDLRVAQSSRYQVYKGMREALGVCAETWLTSMIFAPNPTDPESLSVTAIHGALAMRRLRADIDVHFTSGRPPREADGSSEVREEPIDLSEFYTNEPATLETRTAGGQLVHRLAHYELGRRALVDMLTVSHEAHGSRRYATPERRHGGAIVIPDVPAKTLIFDVLLHDDAFPGAAPELIAYRPSPKGAARPFDPSRDIDRIPIAEQVELLGGKPTRFDIPEVPNYGLMMEKTCRSVGLEEDRLRLVRFRLPYPLYGFQYVLAFQAPERIEKAD